MNTPGQLGGRILCQEIYVHPTSTTGFTPGQSIRFMHDGYPGIPMDAALHSCRECDEGCTGLEGGSTVSPIVAEGNRVLLRVNVRIFRLCPLMLNTSSSSSDLVVFYICIVAWMSAMERLNWCSHNAQRADDLYHQIQAGVCSCEGHTKILHGQCVFQMYSICRRFY